MKMLIKGKIEALFLLATVSAVLPSLALAQNGMQGQSTSTVSVDMFDSDYVEMALLHHQRGLEMAQLAQQRAQDPQVVSLAERLASDQQQEIQRLEQIRARLATGVAMSTETMNGRMSSMRRRHRGMMDQAGRDVTRLREAQDRQFDRVFLDRMRRHHQVGIDMSKDAANNAGDQEIRALAQELVTQQQTEVQEMETIKASLKKSSGSETTD